ncbi:MAG: preprotein translocase subunit TatC [Phycisphaerae bacterium]|nr:preprotein translocase subunit TatC [Phycisphaerae bacterium]
MAPKNPHESSMSLGEHLDELRHRLILALWGIGPLLAISLVFGRQLLELLMEPARTALRAEGLPSSLQATGVLETFNTYFKISLVVTLVLAGPWLLYQLWKFVAPGLYKHERRFVHILIPLSSVLAVTGVVFMYLVILPLLLNFLVHFGSSTGVQEVPAAPAPPGVVMPVFPVLEADPIKPDVGASWINAPLRQHRVCLGYEGEKPLIYGTELTTLSGILQQYRVADYVDTVLGLALAFAGGFQTPAVVLLLGWAGIIDRAWLAKYRKHAVLISSVAAAVLTPGDPWSMVLLWIPMYLLFELGGWLLKVLPSEKVGRRDPAQGEPTWADDD